MIDWNVAAVAAKALMYATSLIAGGGALFLALFGPRLIESERRFVARFAGALAVAALYITIARITVLSALLGDEVAGLWDRSLIQIVFEGSEGRAIVVRALGLIAIAALALETRSGEILAVLGAVAVAASFALTGHAGDVGPGSLPRLLVAAHVLAVSYWIGALIPLFVIASSAGNARAGIILRRFGNIAAFIVPLLIAAGITLLWLLLGSIEAISLRPTAVSCFSSWRLSPAF